MDSGVRSLAYNIEFQKPYRPGPRHDEHNTKKSLRSVEFASDEDSQGSVHSDNVSTVPLKLIVSRSSTTNPLSILSGEQQQDNSSYVASTAETSLAPSVHVPLLPGLHGALSSGRTERDSIRDRERDRDSELIVTLASLSRRIRRRSIDTNCSLAGIPPASIMERLSVNPITPGPEEDN